MKWSKRKKKKLQMEATAIQMGIRMVETRSNIREIAREFNVAPSTAHRYLTGILYWVHPTLYKQVRSILDENWRERSRRGGEATRQKFKKLNEKRGKQLQFTHIGS